MTRPDPVPIRAGAWHAIELRGQRYPLPIPGEAPEKSFEAVLGDRSSRRSLEPPARAQIYELLWHACRIRETGSDSFGRPTAKAAFPSAGGLLSCRIAIDFGEGLPYFYDPLTHEQVVPFDLDSEALDMARNDVKALLPHSRGTVIYVLGNVQAISARYSDYETLLFRDCGCILATLQLCAVWLGLGACIVGTTCARIGAALKLGPEWQGLGGIVVGRAINENVGT